MHSNLASERLATRYDESRPVPLSSVSYKSPSNLASERVAELAIVVKNFHSKLLRVCPAPPPWLHLTGTACVFHYIPTLHDKKISDQMTYCFLLQEADLLPVRDAQVPLGGATRLHRAGLQVRRKPTIRFSEAQVSYTNNVHHWDGCCHPK